MHLRRTAYPHQEDASLYDAYVLWLDPDELPPGHSVRAVTALEPAPLAEIIAAPPFREAIAALSALQVIVERVETVWSESGCFYVRVLTTRTRQRGG